MDERDIDALRKASPSIDLALRELEMREYFQEKLGITVDAAKPILYNKLIGDGEWDCD